MKKQRNVKKENLLLISGLFCISLGLIINRYILEYTIVSDGNIENPFHRVIIILFQLAMVSFGLFFIFIRFKIPAANVFLILSSSILALTAVEFLARIFYIPPAVVAGWRSFEPEYEKNQLGFRGQSIKYTSDDYVVILLGDSQAEGYGCGFKSMPERKLELFLNDYIKPVKVFTLAAGGYGQDQQLLILHEYYEKFRADLVILWQTPKNDIWNNIFPTHWPKDGMPKPTYMLKNDSLWGPNWRMGELIYHSPIRIVSLIKYMLAFGSKDQNWEQYLPKPYLRITDYNGQASCDWQERWDKNIGGMREENLNNEKSHLAMWLKPRSERMIYGLKLTRLLIGEIKKLVDSHNGQLILFRVTTQSKYTTIEDTVHCLNGRYYRTSSKQFNDNMAYLNQGFRTCIIPVTVDNWRINPEDAHLNESAIEQVMHDFALVIKDMILNVKAKEE